MEGEGDRWMEVRVAGRWRVRVTGGWRVKVAGGWRVRVTGGWRVMGGWEVKHRQPDREHMKE